MTKFVQIVLLTVVVLFEANGKPLFQGISFQRGFEINFKPLPRSPITFIRETWSPFGVFGKKHSLQKRNSGSDIVPVSQAPPISEVPEARPAAPVFEHVEEIEHFRTSPFHFLLSRQASRSVAPLPISSPLPPLSSPIQTQPISPVPPIVFSPPPLIPTKVIVTPIPHPAFNDVPPPVSPQVVSITPNPPITHEMPINPPPGRMDGSLPPISSNMVIPPPASGRFTDITRVVPVRENVNSIQIITPVVAVEEKNTPPLATSSVKPEQPRNDIVMNNNSLVRGSRLALYFGSVFLQLMSQFMSNARATFDQMTNPPPVFRN